MKSRNDESPSGGPLVLVLGAGMDGELIGVSLNGFLDVPCKNSGVGFRFFDLPFDLDFPFTFAGGSAKRTFEPSLDDFLELE